jgi:hypothetical protein
MSAVPVLGPLPADSETSKTTTKTEITKPIKSDPQEDEEVRDNNNDREGAETKDDYYLRHLQGPSL